MLYGGTVFRPTRKKALTRGRTDHFSYILAGHEFSAGCYSFTVSNSRLLFSHGQPSQQLLSFDFHLVIVNFDVILNFERELDRATINQ